MQTKKSAASHACIGTPHLSLFNYGLCLMNGYRVEQDAEQGFRLMQKSAKMGFPLAMSQMGMCYVDGLGVAQDFSQARKRLQRASEKGLAQAQFNLSVFYQKNPKPDPELAFHWFRKAAAQGYAPAIRALKDWGAQKP